MVCEVRAASHLVRFPVHDSDKSLTHWFSLRLTPIR